MNRSYFLTEHILQCRICLQDYNESERKRAVVIGCGHTACISCLEILKNETVANHSQFPHLIIKFRCPFCRNISKRDFYVQLYMDIPTRNSPGVIIQSVVNDNPMPVVEENVNVPAEHMPEDEPIQIDSTTTDVFANDESLLPHLHVEQIQLQNSLIQNMFQQINYLQQ